ncbi:hypothetical protein VDGL01_09891 [Verticillium dahliae]
MQPASHSLVPTYEKDFSNRTSLDNSTRSSTSASILGTGSISSPTTLVMASEAASRNLSSFILLLTTLLLV